MRQLLRVAALALSLAACGCTLWPFHRSPSAPPAPLATATSDAGLKAAVTSTKERRGSLVITLTLTNAGTQAIQFKSPVASRVAGFAVAADGRERVGADGGRIDKPTPAAQLKSLAPGAKADLELHYTFEPALAHDSYAWTLTIGNLFEGEQKLADLTLSYTPPH
jgi:hypothetical protein